MEGNSVRNYNSDFLGDCCESGEGIKDPCVTKKELLLALAPKADIVNVVNQVEYDSQINVLLSIISDLQSRVSALENL